jgi:hypothetical protein
MRSRPGTKIGIARWMADRAVDVIRDRFGWDAIGYGSVALALSRSDPAQPSQACIPWGRVTPSGEHMV